MSAPHRLQTLSTTGLRTSHIRVVPEQKLPRDLIFSIVFCRMTCCRTIRQWLNWSRIPQSRIQMKTPVNRPHRLQLNFACAFITSRLSSFKTSVGTEGKRGGNNSITESGPSTLFLVRHIDHLLAACGASRHACSQIRIRIWFPVGYGLP